MTNEEAMKLALEALEKVTTELLAVRDEIAERGGRPTTNVFHQQLWDSSFKAYTDYAIPAASAIKEALTKQEQGEPCGRLESDPEEGHVFVPRIDGDWSMLGKDLYTTPLQRTWAGLSDKDEINWEEGGNLKDLVKSIEAKLRSKNT